MPEARVGSVLCLFKGPNADTYSGQKSIAHGAKHIVHSENRSRSETGNERVLIAGSESQWVDMNAVCWASGVPRLYFVL
jgi:hypothetical protein